MTLYKGPHSLFRALSPNYRLNKAEYLQIYNLRPASLLELDLVIEEVRFIIWFYVVWAKRVVAFLLSSGFSQ